MEAFFEIGRAIREIVLGQLRAVLVAAIAVDALCLVKYNSNQLTKALKSVTMDPDF